MRLTKSTHSIPIRFIELENGCQVPVSHKLNRDGYFRKRWTVDGSILAEMFHRFMYRARNGRDSIPDGFEIDHICKNRACCAKGHLRLVDGGIHATSTNKERYLERHLVAKQYWLDHKPTGAYLGKLFGVSISTACRWIRGWGNDKSTVLERVPWGAPLEDTK